MGGEFKVYTDKNPLTYVLTTAKLDASGQRWITSLVNYSFSLHYKSGKTNIEADALSRMPERISIDREPVKAIANLVMLNDFTEFNENWNLFICKSAQPTPKESSNKQWIKKQKEDHVIGQFLQLRKLKKKPDTLLPEVKTML